MMFHAVPLVFDGPTNEPGPPLRRKPGQREPRRWRGFTSRERKQGQLHRAQRVSWNPMGEYPLYPLV